MKLTHVRAKNFLTFGDTAQQIDFDTFDTIVGSNNSGKTNLLRAISFVGEAFQGRSIDVNPYFHDGAVDKDFEVEVGVKFSDEEIEALSGFLVCACLKESIGRKTESEKAEAIENIKRMVLHEFGKTFKTLFQEVAFYVRSSSQFDPPEKYVRLAKNGQELFIQQYGVITKKPVKLSSYNPHSLIGLLVDEVRSRSPDETQRYITGQIDSLPSLDLTPPDLFNFISRKLDEPRPSAVNITGYRLSDIKGYTDDYSTINKLIRFLGERGFKEESANLFDVLKTIYNSSIIRFSDIRSRPRSFLPMPADIEAVAPWSTLLTGEDLPLILYNLKNSSNPSDRERYRELERAFHDFTGVFSFDIAMRSKKIPIGTQDQIIRMSPEHLIGGDVYPLGIQEQQKTSQVYELFIQFLKNNLPFQIDFVAAGIFEILLLLTAIIGQAEKIILLDEPALNLHPTFQIRILDLMKKSIEKNANQIILVTHSPYFVSTSNLSNLWRFVLSKGDTEIYNLGEIVKQFEKEDEERLVIQFANSDIRALLFSRGVVLVEGPSDRIVVESVDRHLSLKGKGTNLETNEWPVISFGGKYSFGAFVKLSQALKIRFVSVMDYDALMRCDKTIIKSDGTRIKTSPLFFYLHKIGLLTDAETQVLVSCEKSIASIQEPNGQKSNWYAGDCLVPLSELAEKFDVYVFKSDLEGVLRTPITKKESKPLKALEAILRKIEDDTVPDEFYSMASFLKKHIEK